MRRRAFRQCLSLKSFGGTLAVLLPVLAALTACSTGNPSAGSVAANRSGQTFVYECAGPRQLTVRVEGETAWLFLASGTRRLPRVVSASGTKFADGETSYWNKGDAALLVLNGQTVAACKNNRALAVWEDAKFRGVDFRAVGNEPGWHLEIYDEEQVLFFNNYGQERYHFSFVAPMIDPVPRTSGYDLRNEAHRLSITLEGRECSDSMSGEFFETRVSLLFDGKEYFGCGKALH